MNVINGSIGIWGWGKGCQDKTKDSKMQNQLSQSEKSIFQLAIMMTFGEIPAITEIVVQSKESFLITIENEKWTISWNNEEGRWIAKKL